MEPPHIPCLRFGDPYISLDRNEITDCRTGELLATVSQVNAGVVRRDLLRRSRSAREALRRHTVEELIGMSAGAGERFLNGTLPLGEGEQTAEDYVRSLSASSGLPHVMVRRNMEKIHDALVHMGTVLAGLTRGLDPGILERGIGEQFGTRIGYFPVTDTLGLVMPSNSPAVNSLWLPAVALRIPVVLKPGREEPWTPWRLFQAFMAAGAPREAFGFYPTDHEGAAVVPRFCGRSLVFGDEKTTARYAHDPAVQVHGPGYSKILLGGDQADAWESHLDVMVSSVVENGGRSCVNASAILVPRYGEEIADALARRLGPVEPLPADDPDAALSGFANPAMATYIDGAIEADLKEAGAEEVTARYRNGPRLVQFEGATYLRPTIIRCRSTGHALYNREFLCPYAVVVEVPQEEMLSRIGDTLVVSAITEDPSFIGALIDSPLIQRLNLGPVSTMKVSWDQPHEGNMFEFLYHRRSIEISERLTAQLVA